MRNVINKIIKLLTSFFLLIALVVPSLVYGQGTGGAGSSPGTGGVTAPPPPAIIKLLNPLKVNSIADLLDLILQIVTYFATPIIIFFIIYAGFLFVTAQGKPDQITKAKNALLWSVIGGVIILGANVLLTVLQNTVKSLMP